MTAVLLVHGGLGDPTRDVERFWGASGVAAGLRGRGRVVLAPDRKRSPSGWDDEARHLLTFLPSEPVDLVGASNGCSAVARLALAAPHRVRRVVLA
ncbi:alpha/beta fold hydrolase [Actinoalloteichus hymeniacidonis]|uniref:Alpha/beta hydrolase family protein n=1 Tax=Actinoalloteichus hymeniacidonis TaxID=340345 RepID=A0AAC9HSZ3_9PSEU|nr:hypothetical protein [Actinoalloteichus hymeniacidonis]AOS63920.1 Alpha/beta hydrolase family protein [Actinoalloteichus hymeniacidonis]MBB5908024.1 pimeloyl-ACP methyl ester carboxylesterase [Actinoalloteichus hymeniacidonis]